MRDRGKLSSVCCSVSSFVIYTVNEIKSISSESSLAMYDLSPCVNLGVLAGSERHIRLRFCESGKQVCGHRVRDKTVYIDSWRNLTILVVTKV